MSSESKVRGQRSEVRGRKSEVGSQRSEVRGVNELIEPFSSRNRDGHLRFPVAREVNNMTLQVGPRVIRSYY